MLGAAVADVCFWRVEILLSGAASAPVAETLTAQLDSDFAPFSLSSSWITCSDSLYSPSPKW